MTNKKSFGYTLIYFIIALSFFKVPFFMIKFDVVNEIYFVLQLMIFFFFILFSIKEKKINKTLSVILLFLVFNCVVSINKTPIPTIISSFINIAGLCVVVNYSNKKLFYNMVKGFKSALLFLLLINLLTIILYPNGLYINIGNNSSQNWFLGYKNSHILFIYPVLVFSYLDTVIYKNKKISGFDIISFVVACITAVMAHSSTSLIGIFVLLLFILVPKLFKNTKIFNAMTYLYSYIALFFSIVIFRLQNIFDFFIEGILHKDLSFTGRTYIWDYVLNDIPNKIVFGHGDKNFDFVLLSGTTVKSTHNQILQIIYNYGIISLFLFFIILFVGMIKLKKEKNNIISQYLSLCIFMWLIMMMLESYDLQYFLYLIVLANNIEFLININKEGKKYAE